MQINEGDESEYSDYNNDVKTYQFERKQTLKMPKS